MNTKIVAIAAVAIIVVAAVGVGLVLMKDGNGGDPAGEPLGGVDCRILDDNGSPHVMVIDEV